MEKHIPVENIIRPILFIKNKLDKVVDPFLIEEIGITEAQFKILTPIFFHKKINQKDIASFWNISEAAVNRQINYLIKQKLIKKIADKNDLRKINLSLTITAETLLKKIYPKIDTLLEGLFKDFSQDDREKILPMLAKIIKILEIDYPEPFTTNDKK